MRKHKSVVAVLLAVMMIFTFMPTMAFAGTGSQAVKSWDTANKYAKVTDVNEEEFNTVRQFAGTAATTNANILPSNVTNGQSGRVTANPDDKAAASVGGTAKPAPSTTAQFYDLDGSSLVYGVRTTTGQGQWAQSTYTYKKIDGTSWTQTAFNDLLSNGNTRLYVELVEPDYTKAVIDAQTNGTTYTKKKAYVPVTLTAANDKLNGTATFDKWTLTFNEETYKSSSKEAQTVKFEVKSILPASSVIIDGVNNYDLYGTVASATVTIDAPTATPQTAKFYLDKVGTGLDEVLYDGKAHTVVVDPTPGYSVAKYMVRNSATGKYEEKSSVTVTDVEETAISFYAVFKDAKGNEVNSNTASVNLKSLNAQGETAARKVYIGFDQKASENDSTCQYTVPSTSYDAADYLVTLAEEKSTASATTAEAKEAISTANANAKNAVETNAALIKEWFNDFYYAKDVTTKSDQKQGQVVLQIAEKELTSAEVTALNKKYAGLLRNVGTPLVLTGTDSTLTKSKATIVLNGANKNIEVEFVSAPSKKVYHVKKAKSLKKAKSFTVKAEADNGSAVMYKLINANSKIKINKTTGKITLKKGLAKGTYNIKVKAYVPNLQNGVTGSETQAIKIVVKK